MSTQMSSSSAPIVQIGHSSSDERAISAIVKFNVSNRLCRFCMRRVQRNPSESDWYKAMNGTGVGPAQVTAMVNQPDRSCVYDTSTPDDYSVLEQNYHPTCFEFYNAMCCNRQIVAHEIFRFQLRPLAQFDMIGEILGYIHQSKVFLYKWLTSIIGFDNFGALPSTSSSSTSTTTSPTQPISLTDRNFFVCAASLFDAVSAATSSLKTVIRACEAVVERVAQQPSPVLSSSSAVAPEYTDRTSISEYVHRYATHIFYTCMSQACRRNETLVLDPSLYDTSSRPKIANLSEPIVQLSSFEYFDRCSQEYGRPDFANVCGTFCKMIERIESISVGAHTGDMLKAIIDRTGLLPEAIGRRVENDRIRLLGKMPGCHATLATFLRMIRRHTEKSSRVLDDSNTYVSDLMSEIQYGNLSAGRMRHRIFSPPSFQLPHISSKLTESLVNGINVSGFTQQFVLDELTDQSFFVLLKSRRYQVAQLSVPPEFWVVYTVLTLAGAADIRLLQAGSVTDILSRLDRAADNISKSE
jgi:hypothetical protein